MVTDYLFLFAMVDERSQGINAASNLDTLVAVGAGSIGAAFLINLLLTCYVLFRERRRRDFAKVRNGVCLFVCLASV